MQSGNLDREITIQVNNPVKDAAGQRVANWTDLMTVFARVSPVRGTERFIGDQTVSKAEVIFRIRYRSGISTLNRIIYEGREYDILDVMELGRKEGLDLPAKCRGENATN